MRELACDARTENASHRNQDPLGDCGASRGRDAYANQHFQDFEGVSAHRDISAPEYARPFRACLCGHSGRVRWRFILGTVDDPDALAESHDQLPAAAESAADEQLVPAVAVAERDEPLSVHRIHRAMVRTAAGDEHAAAVAEPDRHRGVRHERHAKRACHAAGDVRRRHEPRRLRHQRDRHGDLRNLQHRDVARRHLLSVHAER